MKVKDLTKTDPGFQYVVESMEFMSTAGRRVALDSEFLTDSVAIEAEWDRLSATLEASRRTDTKRALTDLRHYLMQLHDLQGTLASLASHTTLNEVELFEVKHLSLLGTQARKAINALGLAQEMPLPDTGEVFDLLDPDHTGIANFYIYDSYDPRLGPLRRELKALQEHDGDPGRIGQLLAEQSELQGRVCTALSDRLHLWAEALAATLEGMAYADSLLAKADLALRWGLCRPTLAESLRFEGLWNPRLKHRNEQLGLRYQAIDIALAAGATLVTGANMAGKTVLLKSVGTAQAMAQCGMYVPATSATTVVFDTIATSIGDEQNEMNGLSSYASEIIKISTIVGQSRSQRLLALIDEPARTTNPTEGKALVQALIGILGHATSFTLVTTHYDHLEGPCRRLRVRGFVEGMENAPLTPQNINRFIDYSLDEDLSGDVPHEALRIATILGCDSELIALAKKNINQ